MSCELIHYFTSMLLLSFAVVSGIAGVFSVYFGSQKARYIGALLVLAGVCTFVVFLWSAWLLPFLPTPPLEFVGCITDSILAVGGAVVGFGFTIIIFLIGIIKA